MIVFVVLVVLVAYVAVTKHDIQRHTPARWRPHAAQGADLDGAGAQAQPAES